MNLSQASGQGNDPTLTNRIQQAAFALTMLVVLAIGGTSLTITLLQIPSEERHLHSDAVRIIGTRVTSDLANEIAGVERLANSSLIWTALTDSFGREAYLQPFLTGRDNIESGERILLMDYRTRPVAGLAPDDVDASVLSAFAHDVLGAGSPLFRIVSNGHPTLLAGFPVIFPYTEEAIGVLIASIDLHATFRTATVGIAEHHGIALLHRDGETENELARVPAEPGDVRNPARFPIQLPNHPQAELLSLSYYSTSRHWLGSVLTLVGAYFALALMLGIAVWLVARYIAARVTRRLNALADACRDIAAGRHGEIPDDPSPDEIGVLSRTLRHAIEAYDRINLGLEERIRQKTAELSTKERQQRQLLQAMAEGVVLVDAQKRIAYVNPAASAILDIDPRQMVGRVLDTTVTWRPMHEDGHDLRPDEFPAVRALMTGEPQRDVVTGVHRPDGELRWLAINAEPIHPQPGAAPDGVVLSFRDITDRRRMETELRTAATVFSNVAEAVIVTDRDNHIVAVNPAFTRITGYTPDEVLGRNPRLLASGRHDQAYYRAMWADITGKGIWQGEMWNRKKDGEIYPQWAAISTVHGGDGGIGGYVSVFSDITSIKQTEMELRQLAYFDPLTGLVNRMLFEERVEQAVSRAARSSERFAVLFIDLDRFKNINDSLGHEAGDVLLREVGDRIAARVRKSDTVSRRGGDEFTVLLEPCPNPQDAARLAEELQVRLSEAVTLPSGARVFTGGSIGIALYPDDGANASDLLRNADTAMYAAKESGRGRYRFYSGELGQAANTRLQLETRLRQAIETDALDVAYQAQVDARDGRILGVEALCRWHDPELGEVSPMQFIPVAEESGLIHALGMWVLRRACSDGMQWRERGFDLKLAVNISSRQLGGRLYEDIRETLQRSGFPPERLELELTESALVDTSADAHRQLDQLRTLGVALAIDDFGTGYSSLAYLKHLAVHKLKIDRSFVRDLGVDRDDEMIVATVISIGHQLQLAVTAEGVETPEQQRILDDLGCDLAQGYLHGRPMPAGDFLRTLTRTRASANRTPAVP